MRAKEVDFMTLKMSVHQQYITIPNVYASKNRVSVYIKQKQQKQKEKDKSIIMNRNFNILFSSSDRTTVNK